MTTVLKFNSQHLRDALACVQHFRANDESRPILCATLLEPAEDNKVRFVTTDSYKLVVLEIPHEGDMPEFEPVMIRFEYMADVNRTLARNYGVELTIGVPGDFGFTPKKHWHGAGCILENPLVRTIATGSVVAGEFPNWKQLAHLGDEPITEGTWLNPDNLIPFMQGVNQFLRSETRWRAQAITFLTYGDPLKPVGIRADTGWGGNVMALIMPVNKREVIPS